jgi:tetratricopeptide (TPR) repeat protein
MFKHYRKGALICALLPIGLLMGGCSTVMGEGNPGYSEFEHGNYAEAKADFTKDLNNRPNSPYSQFNMGDSYRQEGDNIRADGMFHEAAANGKDSIPDNILELGGDNRGDITARTMACRHLHEDRQLDVNCDDRMTAEIAPTPAAMVQETPSPIAVEPASTTPAVLVRKQDRN